MKKFQKNAFLKISVFTEYNLLMIFVSALEGPCSDIVKTSWTHNIQHQTSQGVVAVGVVAADN